MDEHTSHELAYKKGYEQGKQDAMKWIPVTERLPKAGKRVVAFKRGMDGSYTFLAKIVANKWFDVEWNVYRYQVTHWMPLPEPPKGE